MATRDERDDISEFEEKIENTKLSKEAKDKALAELKKLKQMSPMSAEATVVRNYLDWLLSIPWGIKGKIKKDIAEAQAILDQEHYGLEKVKERILEYLAVQARTNKLKGPILCLVGPPGVGKTSLGKSIANATGREFVRMSLGGVRDEAEIRGHRRTYIGSMPGKVIQSMKKAKRTNPLFLLDEIDKMGQDFRGDPAAALLEVLDPEQNATFNDHYLEVDYDLSNVMFVTTANTLNIPPALMDRMEIIRLAGYTEDEKLEIAKRHLMPEQYSAHGLEQGEWTVEDGALKEIIRRYTREAGVRSLEREIAKLARKAVKEILTSSKTSIVVTAENVHDFLGVPKYRYGEAELEDQVGIVTGLAWTEVGGELLTIEGVMMPGKGRMTRHGQPARRDEGIDSGRERLRALALGRLRHPSVAVREARHPRARAGRRDAEGWTVRRHCDDDGDHLGSDRHSCPQGRGDDGRDHASRSRAADRRPQGEAPCGAARRHQDGHHSGGERQGLGGDSDRGADQDGHHSGRSSRRRPEDRSRAHAGSDHVG